MKRRDEVLVGIFATVALVLGFIGALWLARGGLAPGYPLYAKFVWGAGLKQGQPVLLAGVNVGYVDNVALQRDGMLVVTLRVRNEYKVPMGTRATIEPNGFFGDMLVALKPSLPSPDNFAVGDTIPPGRASPSVGDVLTRIDTLAGHLTALTGALRKQLVDENGLAEIRTTIQRASSMFAAIEKAAAEQNEELKKTEASLRRVASAVDSAQIDSTLRSLRGAGLAVDSLTRAFRATSSRVDALLDKTTSGGGTAAKLLNDPGAYTDLRSLMQRMDSLLTEFQKNPRKFIKLSIF
ncbi:MAG: MlaD family protein [Gemmatimonadota bacterium]|nr:MlaD family protein [Gemmatimonadota bacterium]